MQDDHELIEQVLQGDKEAYTQIFDRYKARIYTFLYRMIGHPQDAQDI
ncbi:helix-turn-helix domain-containing protein [Brevibacillus laterosporus]